MGYELWILLICAGFLIAFISYEKGYLRGMDYADDIYQEICDMNNQIFDMQQETIKTYKDIVNEWLEEKKNEKKE